MYLKRLEMHGFKSFADRIDLKFPQGITAVVGPNGSGKSNISDALRWVLGEQSAKSLRGSKMDDVIFIGSDSRKPLGMAEVTIVLDNADGLLPLDYHEVAITRRLYRSGETDYLINRTPVRLRDIHELLYDTGLGKEAYSVIGQGKIDAILSAKAEERRAVFEEAAGIVKYKNKKIVAMKKLTETDSHLTRVEDILGEIKGQMEPLSIQAEIAKRFLGLQAELQSLEVNYTTKELERLEAESQNVLQQLLQLTADLEDEKRKEVSEDAVLTESRLMLTTIEETITKNQDRLLTLTAEKGRLSGEADLIEEKIRTQEARLQELSDASKRVDGKRQSVVDEENRLRLVIDENEAKLTEIGKNLSEQEELCRVAFEEIASSNANLEALRNQRLSLHQQLAELNNRRNSYSLQAEFHQEKIGEIESRNASISKEMTALDGERAQHEAEFQNAQNETEQKKARLETLKREIVQDEQSLSGMEEKLLDQRQNQQRIDTRLGMLDEMERGYQGYFQGVKSLLTEAKREKFNDKIEGVVADLIQVKKGYETAIEVALGSALQNVVIHDDTAAEEAVNYLKRSGHGRATFLPLNLVTGEATSFPRQALEAHRSISAMDAIGFDAKFRGVIAFLLGHTVIAPDMKTAVSIFRTLGKRYRVVTIEGEIVHPGGSITGGSLDRRRVGILSRKREIDDLRRERNLCAERLETLLRQKETLMEQIKNKRLEIQETAEQLHRNEIRLSGLTKDGERLRERALVLRAEQDDLMKRLDEYRNEGVLKTRFEETMQTEIRAVEEGISLLENEYKAAEDGLRDRQAERDRFQAVLSNLREERVRLEQGQSDKRTLLDGLVRQIQENQDETERMIEERKRLESEIINNQEERLRLQKRLEDLAVNERSTEDEFHEHRAKRDQLRQELARGEEKLKGFRQIQNGIQQQIHRLELQQNRNKLTSETQRQHLTETYGLDWEILIEESWVAPEKPKERLEQLRREIRALGPVNTGAVEEFERLQERHNFLEKQFVDLTHAKSTLERVIDEIERTIRKRFLETFAEIREAFIEIFTGLFTGGKADLVLMNPEDPLETGIDILAQPPGKRLQSLSLLSGGERAMTAVALLFSILKVKPSPFCILDEIDATLDEVNVSRFADLLTEFSKDLQFIVVTHRRGTMEMANALYGVTMEELGVSKLISIDLQRKVG